MNDNDNNSSNNNTEYAAVLSNIELHIHWEWTQGPNNSTLKFSAVSTTNMILSQMDDEWCPLQINEHIFICELPCADTQVVVIHLIPKESIIEKAFYVF